VIESSEADKTVLRELRNLEGAVADLRAQTGVEAFELRARVRELERRLDELAKGESPGLKGTGKPPKAERAEARHKARAGEGTKTRPV
jgi:hypothetical protein